MNFLNPVAFFLGLLLPLIVLMYLLKLKRTERLVSSTYLWRRMVRDLEANAPWQKLRRNLLLLLQLLFLSALILATARPFTWRQGFGGKALILIIDTSASMSATDVPPSRLEAAKRQIEDLVMTLPQDVRITVITAGRRARIITAASLDRRVAFESIKKLTPELSASDLQTALQLATAISARQPQTEVVIISDGGFDVPSRIGMSGQIRYIPIGSSGENQSINLLKLEKNSQERKLSAFIQMANHGDTTTKRRLKLLTDGAVYNVYDVNLPAGQVVSLLVEDLPPIIRSVEAHFMPGDQAPDYLSSDDGAAAVNRQQEPIAVNLVSQGNRFLETALSLLPGVKVSRIEPAGSGDLPPADITILESSLPVTATLPTGNLFFIAPIRSTEFFSVTGALENPTPLPAEDAAELLKYVSLENVNILDAAKIPLPEYAHATIVSLNDPTQPPDSLLFTGEKAGRRIAVLAFSLQHSDLPLQVAFPILIANLVQWLAPGRIADVPSQVNPGEAISLMLPLGSAAEPSKQEISFKLPDGQIISPEAHDGKVTFSDISQAGIYEIILNNGDRLNFVVNSFIQSEAEIAPVNDMSFSQPAAQGIPANLLQSRREWWRVLVGLSLFILVLEWLVYHRPTLLFLARKITLKNWNIFRGNAR